MSGTTQIHFTNGAGNNIFQYVFARLFSEIQGTKLSHPALPVLGISERKHKLNPALQTVRIRGSSKEPINYHKLLKPLGALANYDLKIYPEDYTLYVPIMDRLRSWFSRIPKTNTRDLVFHLRLGDRLVMKSTYKPGNYVSPEQFAGAIESFRPFEKMHIVTDMPVWKDITEKEISGFVFHRGVKEKDRVDPKIARLYFNALRKRLDEYNPIVRVGNSVRSDFEYMRSFDKILFQHGTLAWWAAALSEADEVALYGRWRSKKNINLGWSDLPGWRQWGPAMAPPHDLKSRHLKEIAKEQNIKTFVETGTRGGTTLFNLKDDFAQLFSVEIIEKAYQKAKSKLKNFSHINLYCGDSVLVLPKILQKINEPSLFWLDAHDGRNSTPIAEELKIILQHDNLSHILIIDDRRYFGTEVGYPTKEQIEDIVKTYRPRSKIDYKFDSIRIWL